MTTTTRKTPAETVIQAFGGVRPLAKLLDLNPSSVCRWARPAPLRAKTRRYSATGRPGTSGFGSIPSPLHRRILELARQENISLTADHLIYGSDTVSAAVSAAVEKK